MLSTSLSDFHTVQDRLREAGIEFDEAELAMIPTNTINVEGKDATRLVKLVAALEDHDDVLKLYANFEVDDEAFAAIES